MTRRPAVPPAVASIGILSRRAGCNVETIRYYERIGLMPEPPRTAGGHRSYGRAHERRLVFVRRCRELGFSIESIRILLALVDGGDYTCAEVKSVTDRHLDDVRAKIADLKKLERSLRIISAACDGGQVPECPVIDSLYQSKDERARKTRRSSRRGEE
ncbi:MAG TPA: helix-turn-helix domain-containing protein [Gammaproteobacteria bacterium]|nr:helix-turn-helix domain-containing protein [Gammaproteobacteria bacterium]